MATVTYSSAGTGNWLCPVNVFSVTVACWGGGGGGAQGGTNLGGPGGGGGEYASAIVAVTPGRLYKWTAGQGGFSRGASYGGSSSFAGDAVAVIAHGGQGGNGTGLGGTGSSNATHFNGGNGGGNGGTLGGGGGGSSAGTGAPGGNGGSPPPPPAAGGTPPAGGGGGGSGGAVSLPPGVAGSSPGGGGGGASAGSANAGGFGAPGQVQLTYAVAAQPLVPFFPAGYPLLPSDFNNLIQSPLSFLTSKVVFRAELTTGQAIAPAGGTVVINFDSVLEDPLSGWEAGSHQWLCPAGNTGTYEIAVTASCVNNPNGLQLQALVGLNSKASLYGLTSAAVPTAANGGNGLASGAVPVQLYGGQDTVQGFAIVSGPNGGTAVSTAGQRCQMTITYMSE